MYCAVDAHAPACPHGCVRVLYGSVCVSVCVWVSAGVVKGMCGQRGAPARAPGTLAGRWRSLLCWLNRFVEQSRTHVQIIRTKAERTILLFKGTRAGGGEVPARVWGEGASRLPGLGGVLIAPRGKALCCRGADSSPRVSAVRSPRSGAHSGRPGH